MSKKLILLVSVFAINLLMGACQPASDPGTTPPAGTTSTATPTPS
ncbi:hypothetical protein NIES4071_34910 [Calothrix sp. NIES-4071]|nr:hypothetical protein NIES4071_34910 [Calothrix sp. NIES-4071]BAZ57810.1 hypothetical protein NIES4105_34840 [Calothrix sp. NIES-4105]